MGNKKKRELRREDKEMMRKWREMAEIGDADAQVSLGNSYLRGEGVAMNKKKAAKWFLLAAEQGNARGQLMIGTCYEKGDGVPLNIEEAVVWFWRSASQGDPCGEYKLALCYLYGRGVVKDLSKAVEWFGKAAEQAMLRRNTIWGVAILKEWVLRRT